MLWTRALPRAGVVASGAVVGVLTEPPEQRANVHQNVRQNLSIYPEPEREIVVVDAPSALETQIGAARRAVTGVVRDVHRRVHGTVSEWIGIEHAVEHRVKALIAPGEPLTPALLYVGVASLSGSILARNRSVLTRAALPPVLFLLSFNYFLPKTAHNASAYVGALEEEHFPVLYQKHAVAVAHSLMAWERLRAAGSSGRERLQDGLGGAVRRVQELTGLKVQEALGRGARTAAGEAVEKAEGALQSVKDAVVEARQPGEKAEEKKGE